MDSCDRIGRSDEFARFLNDAKCDRIGRSCMRGQKRKYKMRMLLSVKIHE